MGYEIDRGLIEFAKRTEGAAIVDGTDDQGNPVLMIVVTGANVGLVKKYAGEGKLYLDTFRQFAGEK